MRKIIYILLITALFFVPLERIEIKNLLPVKAIAVYKTDKDYVIELDCGLKGRGNSVSAAIRQLKSDASAIVYLKTTVYLFVEDALLDIGALQKKLKNSVKIYYLNASGRVGDLTNYLDAHGELTELHQAKTK